MCPDICVRNFFIKKMVKRFTFSMRRTMRNDEITKGGPFSQNLVIFCEIG